MNDKIKQLFPGLIIAKGQTVFEDETGAGGKYRMSIESIVNAYGNLDEKAIVTIIQKRKHKNKMKKGKPDMIEKGGHVLCREEE